jgi:predicted O-methyltransferase YrrM
MLKRIRNIRRTVWQFRAGIACGTRGVRLAEQMILTDQCIQRKWELVAMMARLKRLRPQVVVEIGTYRGGSLRCWSSICPATTKFISIDLPWETSGAIDPAADIIRTRDFLRPGQILDWLRMDSHAATTKDKLLAILGTQQVDFLFIDGDHSYSGVKRDYELYRGLVRPGGLIAFHDIVPSRRHAGHQVHVFWADLKKNNRVDELVDNDILDEPWGGIGVLHV